MQLDSADHWVIAICFGALMVGMYSWSRFDEPSYDSQSEYFARYKPRFSTSHARYLRAKWGYVCAIGLVYFIFSVAPELFNAVNAADANAVGPKPIEGSVPLAVALGLITLQNTPGLKDLERRIRGFLHSVARIPECVRRTVAQMRGSPFSFGPNAVASQTRKLGAQIGGIQQPKTLSKLILEDDTLHTWYSIGCVLCALSETNQAKTGIDPLFFDYYRDELDSISAKHVALAELVREHLAQCLPANGSANLAAVADPDDSAAFREIRDLRDRLYTFVACGVHSSVKSDAEALEIVRRLGFAITPTDVGQKPFVGPLAGLSFIALVILSIFTGYSTQIFREHLPLLRPGSAWLGAFPVPTGTLGLFAWSWSTAVFYFAAILGALAVRSSRVAKREWFDINNLHRERPILRYITPTLVGTALGGVTLTIIALIGGPAFKASFTEVSKAVGEALRQTLPWFPLATVMAFIAVVLSDSQLKDDGFGPGALRRGVCGALAMALVGFLTSQLSISNGISDFAANHQLEITREVSRTGIYLSLFIAVQIGLIALALSVIVQVAELYTARSLSFVGTYVDAVTRQGPLFCISFDGEGAASLFAPGEVDLGAAPALCRGQWQQFPEGTAVKWNIEAGDSRCKAGAFGLMSSYGDSLIYEGYDDRFSGTADFVAQVQFRSNVKSTVGKIDRAPRILTSDALVVQNRRVGSKLAATSRSIGCDGVIA